MPNYFYTDANGRKQGPVNEQQLKELSARGIITPQTPVETESGRHKGVAGQIPGLQFKTIPPQVVVDHSESQTTHKAYSQVGESLKQVGQSLKQVSEPARSSIFSWLQDYSFRDIRYHIINLWICRILYVIGLIALAFAFIALSGLIILEAFRGLSHSSGASLLLLLLIPVLCIILFFAVCYMRIVLEFLVVLTDWMVETTKAAKIYIENNKKGRDNER